MGRTFAALTIFALALPVSARADDDEDVLQSVFTEGGFELRRDERIFVLYAALNVAGYTRGEPVRSQPFPRYSLHPIRQKLIHQLVASTEKLRPAIDHFLDAHPEPLEEYVAAALTLGTEAPYAATPETSKSLAGLDKLLADFAETSKLKKWSHGFEVDYREQFKKISEPADQPFTDLRKAYHLPDDNPPALILEPNPLDSPEVAVARKLADGSHVVVFGLPAGDGPVDLQPALNAYSALLAAEATKDVTVEGLSSQVDKMHAAGVLSSEVTEQSVVRDSLAAAIAAKLWSKDPGAQIESAQRKGMILAGEFFKALNEPPETYPAAKGPFVTQVAAAMNLDKQLTPTARGPSIHK